MTKKRLVVANWKMYLSTPTEAKAYVTVLRRYTRSFAGVEAWIAPAVTLLPTLVLALKKSTIRVGAQTVSAYKDGAHTGDVSAAMLKGAGAKFVIVGHSERRAEGESEEEVRMSLARAVEADLTAVLCVGEKERDDSGNYFGVISAQLNSALQGFPRASASKLVVAYEPVWAIGKAGDKAMSPSELQEMHIFVRKVLADTLGRERALAVPILYGGSIEPENARAHVEEGGVSGFLVGHASADPKSFAAILSACRK